MTPTIVTTLEEVALVNKVGSISPRTAAIILKVLENVDYIDKWPRGQGLLNWNDDKVSMNLTKIDKGR